MTDRILKTIELVQWPGILSVGFFTSVLPEYKDGLTHLFWTVLSMAVATIVSHYLKRWLNRREKKRNDSKNKNT